MQNGADTLGTGGVLGVTNPTGGFTGCALLLSYGIAVAALTRIPEGCHPIGGVAWDVAKPTRITTLYLSDRRCGTITRN